MLNSSQDDLEEEISSQMEESHKRRNKRNKKEVIRSQPNNNVAVFNPPPVLDLFKIDHIVSRILSCLDVKSLKIARQVCFCFASEGRKLLLKKSFIYAIKSLPTEKSSDKQKKIARKKLENFIKLSGSSISVKLATKYLQEGSKKNIIYILQKVPEFAKRVSSYKYEGSSRHAEVADLARILRYLPNVQIVSTTDFNFQRSHDWAELEENLSDDSGSESDENESEGEEMEEEKSKVKKTNMEIFLRKLESLKELQVKDGINVYHFSEYMPYHNRLKAITHLSLTYKNEGVLNLSHFRDFLRIKSKSQWPISHLTWKVAPGLEENLIRQFLITISNTLQNLEIDLRYLPPNAEGHWVDDWYVPTFEMSKLQKLKFVGNDAILRKGLAVALQMTQLKKFEIHSGVKNLTEFISGWEYCPSALGRKLQSLSIEEVKIEGKLTAKDSILLNARLWPKLKSLEVGPISTSLLKSTNLLQYWKNLEHLELDLSEIKSKDMDLYEIWMTGLESPSIYESGVILVSQEEQEEEDDDMNENEFSPLFLRHLKNLKSLKFNRYCLSGDFVLYNCIQLLKNLQTLHFSNSQVSGNGIADLKKFFGDGRISILVDNKYV